MSSLGKFLSGCTASACALAGLAGSATAGDYNGDFLVRLQGTYLLTDDDTKSIKSEATGDGQLRSLADTYTTNSMLPTATLTYFFNQNLAAELLCCFAHSNIKI